MATLEERLAKMRADLRTMQSGTAGVQTTAPTTTRTTGTQTSAPVAGKSGAKTGTGADSLDQRLARMRADLQTMKTAGQIAGQTAAREEPDDVPGLELPSIDSYMPESVGSSNRSFMYRALDNASALEGKTPVSVKLSSAQSSYDRVTKELEDAMTQRRATSEALSRGQFNSAADYDAAVRADSDAAGRIAQLEEQQSQYANQLYAYRNERDAARLRTDTGSIGAKYSALRDADDELNRLQTALHNWDVSPYTPEEQQAMAQRVKELTAQVDRQKREFDAEAKAAGYVTTYDGLREYEKNQREKATADEIVRQAGESANTPGGAWAMSALSVLGKPWETVETVAGMLGSIGHNNPGNLDTYRPLDTGRFTMSRVGETTRGTVGGNLAEAFPLEIGGQNVAQMLYDTGMSIADSAYLAATLGAAGSAVGGAKAGANLVGGATFGSAAANQMQSVAERGGTNNQILMGGIAAGTAEVLFESFSIEKLLAEKSVTGWKSWVKETLREFENGQRYVDVESDQARFDGLSEREMSREARAVIQEKFKGKVIGLENRAYVNGRTAAEYSYPAKKLTGQAHEAKMRASTELDNLLDAGTNFRTEPDGRDGHNHPEAVGDFRYFDTVFKVGNEYYSGVINIEPVAKGLLLKDVTQIRNITQDIRSSYGDEPQTTFLRDASMDSVAQSGGNVNPRRELTFQEEVQRQRTGEDPRDAEAPHPSPSPASSVSPDGLTPSPEGKALGGAGIESGEGTEGENRRAYSLQNTEGLGRELYELRRQNQRLEEKNEWLKAQFKRTDWTRTTDGDAVRKEAKRLIKDFSSSADLDSITGQLRQIYDSMAGGGDLSEPETRQWAKSVAEEIIDSASETDDAMWRDYEGLRKFLKDTKIKVPRDTWGGLDAVGGYNEFRRQYFGRLNLSSTEGRSIDDVYNELSGEYPGLFDEDAHPNPEDQIVQIAEVLDAIRPETFNPYAGDSAGAADWLAGEIMERFWDMPGTKPTYADRAALREARARTEAWERAENRFQSRFDRQEANRKETVDRMKQTLKKVRERRDQKIKEIKEKNRQANARMRERMTATQVKDTVRRHAEGLSRKLLRPTDKQNIPERLRGTVVALLDSIDLESKYAYETTPEGQFRRVALTDKDGNPIQRENPKPTKRTEAARALREALEALKQDPQFDLTVDPDLEDNLKEIAGFGDVRLADMTGDQARTVWQAVQAVEHSITLSNRLLGDTKYARVSDMAEAMWDAAGDRKDRRNFAVRPLAAADKLLNLDMMTPETFFHRLGKPGEEVHRQMRAAQDRQITITNEGVEYFHSALKESGLTAKDLKDAERENHTFTTAGGQEITLTTAQLMDLYALSHRKQAMDHIYTGGLRTQGGRSGAFTAGQAAPVHVTLMDVANMLHELTPAQKGFVDRLQNYMSTTLAARGNEATMEVYGYEKFKEKAYWPIKVNRNETRTDPAQEARSKTIPGYGMTKALTPNANNSVMLRSAVDTYAEHLNQMATYAGWLAASENITKLHNFTFFEDGQRTGTIKELFDRVITPACSTTPSTGPWTGTGCSTSTSTAICWRTDSARTRSTPL